MVPDLADDTTCMPLTVLPSAEILAALGKFALKFADLEHWINMGIIEADGLVNPTDCSDVAWVGFKDRVKRLHQSFKRRETEGIITFRPFLPSEADLIQLAYRRNDVLHGSPWTLLQFDRPASDVKPGEIATAKTLHVSHNLATGTRSPIDVPTLDALSKKAGDYAEQITFLTGDLALAKRAAGQQPLTFNL